MFIIGVSSEMKNKHYNWRQILVQIIKLVVNAHWVLSLDSCLSVSFLRLCPELSSLPTQPFPLPSLCLLGCFHLLIWLCRPEPDLPQKLGFPLRRILNAWRNQSQVSDDNLVWLRSQTMPGPSFQASPSAPRKPCSPWQQEGFCYSLIMITIIKIVVIIII